MPDLALLATVLTSIKTATDIARGLREAGISFEKAELKLKLADLMTALADARIAVSSVQEELLTKDREIQELRESLDLKKAMKYEAPFYWLEEDGKRDGPFCQQCYDSVRKAIRVQEVENPYWRCNTCGHTYTAGSSRPRQIHVETEFDPRDP
jgi:hypothetical protein